MAQKRMNRAFHTLLVVYSISAFGCDASPPDDDAGPVDAEMLPADAGDDAGSDSGALDAGLGDAGLGDAGLGDAGLADAGLIDSGADAGPTFHTVTVTTSGAGEGTVTSTPAGVSCPSACEIRVEEGSSVTLAALAGGGSTFTGWSGGGCEGSGTANCELASVLGDVTVEATFAVNPTLTVTRDGAGSGTVSSVPSGIDCGTDCSETVGYGSAFELSATPSEGSVFTGWSGGGCAGTDPCTLTLTAATTVTATFGLDTQTLTVLTDGTGDGTVTSDPTGVDCGGDCTEDYLSGAEVTLTAAPDTGSTFTGWSGGGCSGTGPCVVTMSTAQSVTATFTIQTFTVTVEVVGTGSGGVTSDPVGIDCGTDCTLTYDFGTELQLDVSVALGSRFLGWSVPGCGTMSGCTFTVTEDTTVTATLDDPSTVTCTLREDARFCTNGTLPEIDLGALDAETCRTSCETEMTEAGMLEGCWVIATLGTCYCRSGTLAYGDDDGFGGVCQ